MNEMNINDVLSRIPHRFPMLLVDRVLNVDPGKHIHAYKNVTVNEPFFAGHYPDMPIMPGVLIIEALAQAGALLFSTVIDIRSGSGNVPLFAGVDKVRFKQPVVPGDQVHLKVDVVNSKKLFWKMSAVATVDEKIVCTAELTTAIKELKE